MSAHNYRIDSHKLLFHPERVATWVTAENDWNRLKLVHPIYMEISPIGACNHRCTFCALDYMGYRPHALDIAVMRDRFFEMGALGVKSVMFAGEGEPLLHKQINEMAVMANRAGIDIAFTTNGVLLKDRFIEQTLPCTSWIKVSCNAGTQDTYARIHQTSAEDFELVVRNLTRAVRARDAARTRTTIGVQMILLPENASETVELARICRDEIGADYFVVKPYSQHKFSHTRQYEKIRYAGYMDLAEPLKALQTDRFHVVFRSNTIRKLGREKPYPTCQATPFFWAYVSARGDVYTCSAYLGDRRFNVGNLNEKKFGEIWHGEKRRHNWSFIANQLDVRDCRINCRMEEINRYLWQLRHPSPHDNFI